ncbi:MAG TPA: hypothetical protein VFQ24_06165 [Terriglobia bacterium]|nr:hypothetical protein [Terriglobia bacterium]
MKQFKNWSDVKDYDELPIRVRRSEYERMSSNDRKRMGELRVFMGFASVSGLSIDLSSVESIDSPFPDIRCNLSGSPYFFELAEVTDENLARRYNESLRTRKITGGSYSHDEPLIKRIITFKSQKNYQTKGAPIDLVLYYWKQTPHRADVTNTVSKLRPVFEQLRSSTSFSRIWLYEHPVPKVLSVISI